MCASWMLFSKNAKTYSVLIHGMPHKLGLLRIYVRKHLVIPIQP